MKRSMILLDIIKIINFFLPFNHNFFKCVSAFGLATHRNSYQKYIAAQCSQVISRKCGFAVRLMSLLLCMTGSGRECGSGREVEKR